jgi:Lar family restriction alleviation protein
MYKLEPCPFCGDRHNLYTDAFVDGWRVICSKCLMYGPLAQDDVYEAIELWNERNDDD